jgi:hypothetical protein
MAHNFHLRSVNSFEQIIYALGCLCPCFYYESETVAECNYFYLEKQDFWWNSKNIYYDRPNFQPAPKCSGKQDLQLGGRDTAAVLG